MTGAAIASAGMSVVNGIGARNDAKDAQRRADQEAALSAEQRRQAMEIYDQAVEEWQANKINIEDLQNFLNQMSEEGIEYAQGLMDRWEGAFGSIQDNLSTYYNNLDPVKYSTENKARLNESLQKSMQQFNETMAATGLQSAGMKQQAAKEAAFKQAAGNAQIDLASEDKVRNMQQGWLNFGENQRQAADLAMGTALDKKAEFGTRGYDAMTDYNKYLVNLMKDKANFVTGQADATQGIADRYGQSAAQSSAAAGNYFGNAMKSGLTAYNSYNNNNGLGSSLDNGWLY